MLKLDLTNFQSFIDRLETTMSLVSPGPLQDGVLNASDEYHESMRQRFAEASSGGSTWTELADSTIEQHKQKGLPLPSALKVSGALEKSLQRGDPDHVLETTETSVIEGTQNDVAGYQHYGTKNIPARPILVEPTSDTLEKMKEKEVEGVTRWIEGR